MALSKKPYKGTRDFFPPQKRVQDYIFDKMRETAALYGYEPYEGPMIEEVELYKAKSGEELINEQIYSFTDRGNRFVAIRPEMTPTLARMVASIHREAPKPIRLFAIPNLMRYENPQKGRLREHWQFNCDVFGAPEYLGELEILELVTHLLVGFGANETHFSILTNDRNIVDTVFSQVMKLDDETRYRLYKIVDKSKKINGEALQKMVSELGLSSDVETIFYNYLKLTSFEEASSFLKEHGQTELAEKIDGLISILNESRVKPFVQYDPAIVRGLDYYTGVVFEIFDKNPENPRAICGGGAYANLLKIFNEPALPAVGFGLGDVTLTDFLTTHKLLPELEVAENDLFLTFQDENALSVCQKLAHDLRRKGVRVITHLEPLKFKKVFPLAEKRGARFVSLIGDRELAEGTIQLKDMTDRSQHNVKFDDLDQLVQLLKQ